MVTFGVFMIFIIAWLSSDQNRSPDLGRGSQNQTSQKKPFNNFKSSRIILAFPGIIMAGKFIWLPVTFLSWIIIPHSAFILLLISISRCLRRFLRDFRTEGSVSFNDSVNSISLSMPIRTAL